MNVFVIDFYHCNEPDYNKGKPVSVKHAAQADGHTE